MQKNYTKNIHIYPVNNKFNKNILCVEDKEYNIFSIASQPSIYKYLYTNESLQNKEDIKNNFFIINSSLINNEISDFIRNFHNTFNIWIFIDNNSFVLDSTLNVKYITYKNIENLNSKILPYNIVDKSIYSNLQNIEKIDQLVYFFNPQNNIQTVSKLEKYLYPTTNLRIKLFDNDKFNHPQNLGYLSENDRGAILRESRFYLCDNTNYYVTEALLSGCILINLDDSADIEDQIKSNKNIQPEHFIYYVDFLGELCNEE